MKAVVMQTRDNEASVLLKDGTFRVVRGNFTVGETIEYREKKRSPASRWTAAAAALVVALGTGGGFWYDAHYVAYAEISLDVNPSIIYTVNKQDCVLEVKAVNDEAAGVVSTLQRTGIRFMPVSQAIDAAMTIFGDEGYLDAEKEDYVLMNVSADNTGFQERLTAEIKTGMERVMERNSTLEYRVDRSDRATAARASENHMSTGRYALWEQEGSEKQPEEFADMPVRELMGIPAGPNSGSPEEAGAPTQDSRTPSVPPDGFQEQADQAPSNRQDAPSDESQQDPAGEARPPFQVPEQNQTQDPQPDGQTQDRGTNAPPGMTMQPPAPQEAPPEANGVQPPPEEMHDPHPGFPSDGFQPPMQREGPAQDSFPAPERDSQGNGLPQNPPGNPPGNPGNQPPQ